MRRYLVIAAVLAVLLVAVALWASGHSSEGAVAAVGGLGAIELARRRRAGGGAALDAIAPVTDPGDGLGDRVADVRRDVAASTLDELIEEEGRS